MVNLTINGEKVKVKEGTTILGAAESVGIKIPNLCYHKNLTPTSKCRLCVVEVNNAASLVASCSYPVKDGLDIKTNTPRVIKARKLIIELILSDHPADCLVCEKNSNCKLQDYAYEFGVKDVRFQGEKHNYPIDTNNPFIIRDYNKCILCGRCVNICNQEQGSDIINYTYRGFNTKIASCYDRGLEESNCVFCGQCVSVCPTGALSEKIAVGKGRAWELKKVATVCPFCGCGCNIDLNVKDNQVIKVTSSEKQSINNGNLCVKGRFGFDFINHPQRLKTPLIKDKSGNFKEVSWHEAITTIADKFKELKEAHGPNSIAGISSAKCTNEENYLFQKFMRATIGTNNVDHCARLCHAPTVAGLADSFGSGAMTNSISEIKDTDCILVTGSNTTEAHPIIALEIKKAVKKGAKLIVVDPRQIELAEIATLHLRQIPGTDVAWLNGMMKVIIDEELYDKKFIAARCEDFDLLKETVAEYSLDYVEKISGIDPSSLEKAAKIFAKANKASIIYSMGITQHTTGTDNVLSIANLAMLTGNIGFESTGVNPLRGQNNVQGACDMGALPVVFPGYQKISDDAARTKFENAWKRSLSSRPGLTITEMLKETILGSIKAMYIMGENPMLSNPDINHVEESLKSLEFLVVQDIFLTETAKLAHVVLPGVSFAEKDGTFTNTERRVQRVRKAINPIGHSLPDWKIICDISSTLDYPMEYNSPYEIMEEIRHLTPIYAGITYERIDNIGIQWPCKSIDDPGTKFLHKDNFARGKGKFHSVKHLPPQETTDKEYPFILTTGRSLYHFHTGSMTRRSIGLDEICPQGYVEISLKDSQELNLSEGCQVKISSRRGEIITSVKIKDGLLKGVVFMPFHFGECAANILTNPALDPKSKTPELKVAVVRVEKLEL